eukprot:scaffold54978_cov66-Phaeocystis_antarctica.AAC.2
MACSAAPFAHLKDSLHHCRLALPARGGTRARAGTPPDVNLQHQSVVSLGNAMAVAATCYRSPEMFKGKGLRGTRRAGIEDVYPAAAKQAKSSPSMFQLTPRSAVLNHTDATLTPPSHL